MVWIHSLSYVSLTKNVVNMELIFLAVDSTPLKHIRTLFTFIYFINV